MSAGLTDRLAHMQTLLAPPELPFAERVLVQNVSHKNHSIFMRMTVLVTYIFIPIVSHKGSLCHRGKSKHGIELFIHELLREPLIEVRVRSLPTWYLNCPTN